MRLLGSFLIGDHQGTEDVKLVDKILKGYDMQSNKRATRTVNSASSTDAYCG